MPPEKTIISGTIEKCYILRYISPNICSPTDASANGNAFCCISLWNSSTSTYCHKTTNYQFRRHSYSCCIHMDRTKQKNPGSEYSARRSAVPPPGDIAACSKYIRSSTALQLTTLYDIIVSKLLFRPCQRLLRPHIMVHDWLSSGCRPYWFILLYISHCQWGSVGLDHRTEM